MRVPAGRLAIFFDPAADRIEDRLNYPMFMASAAHNILRIWYTVLSAIVSPRPPMRRLKRHVTIGALVAPT